MNSIIEGDKVSTVPQQVRDEYIQAWVAQGTAQVGWINGSATSRDITRSRVRLMRAMMDVAIDCEDTDHYLACKLTLDSQAGTVFRLQQSRTHSTLVALPA